MRENARKRCMNNGKDTVKACAKGSKTKVEDDGNK
jgi:hypothetical protein